MTPGKNGLLRWYQHAMAALFAAVSQSLSCTEDAHDSD
jgi:hypothetical protein